MLQISGPVGARWGPLGAVRVGWVGAAFAELDRLCCSQGVMIFASGWQVSVPTRSRGRGLCGLLCWLSVPENSVTSCDLQVLAYPATEAVAS